MAFMSTYIKTYRNLLNWRYHSKPNVLSVWIHLLLKANIKPRKLEGIEVGRGQTAISIRGLAEETGMTKNMVVTSLNNLEKTGEIVTKKL